MLTAQAINDKIRASTEARIRTYPCHHLRASNIGHQCERYLYLLIKHWDEQTPHDYGLQNIFDLGNSIEDYTIAKLKETGYEVVTPTQRSWKIENPLVTGREDLRIKDPEDGQLYPVEVKGLSPQEWGHLNSVDDFYASKRHYVRAYPAQLLMYCWKFEKEKGFFALTNKLTGEIKLIEVPFDWDKADALMAKAERIYAALEDKTGSTIPDACDDVSVCEQCQMRHRCTASHAGIAADFDTGELLELIERKQQLSEGYREYNSTNDAIKRIMGNRPKVIAGNYVVTTSTIHKDAYTVAARDEIRVSVKRL